MLAWRVKLKFTLSKEEKIKVYNDVRIELQKNIILRLNILDYDVDTFDEDSFVPNEDSAAQISLYNLIQKLKETNQKIEQIENE